LEKQLRKDANEWDDLFNGGPGLRKSQEGLNTLAEKLFKIAKDSVSKALKRHTAAIGKREEQLIARELVAKHLDQCIKQRKTLEALCKHIFQKNHDLYL